MRMFKKLLTTALAGLIVFTAFSVVAQEPAKAEILSTYDYYLYNSGSGSVTEEAIPKVYTVKSTIRQFESDIATFKNPQDMFVDANDTVYVADTGNNRIVIMDKEGKNVRTVSSLTCKAHKDAGETCTCTKDDKFDTPSGLYVDDEGDIYVADTANARVVHVDADGYYVEEFGKPENDTTLEGKPFDVTKISISNRGVIYLLLKTDFEGFMMLDSTGKYIGNTGMTWTTTDFVSFIWSKLNPTAEAIAAASLKAPPYSNFMIDSNGWVYATITGTEEKQLAKLNTSGTNVYATTGDATPTFGRNYYELDDEVSFDSTHYQSNFVDIAVDKNGIVYALDDAIGNVFIYDQEGNNLAFFGESGDNRGKFSKPVAINLFSDETLAVLDSKTGYITIFKDTEFCRLMKKGATLYYEASYTEAREVWSELLQIDVNYIYAHKAIAKAYYKEEDYQTAMAEYKLAKDKAGYSEAFEKNKALITKEYFFLIVLIVVAVAVLLLIGFSKLKKYAEKLHIKITTWGGEE